MDNTRKDISRADLEKAFYMALGSYAEQEAKKDDQWRDQSIGQLYAHLNHEMLEIRTNLKRNDQLTYLLHNCMDAVSLSCILMAKVMRKAGLLENED